MKKESLINTALFLHILIYCCCFGVVIFSRLFNSPPSSVVYFIIAALYVIGIPITYLIALYGYSLKKERDIFQLTLLIILPIVCFLFVFVGYIAASLSGALM